MSGRSEVKREGNVEVALREAGDGLGGGNVLESLHVDALEDGSDAGGGAGAGADPLAAAVRLQGQQRTVVGHGEDGFGGALGTLDGGGVDLGLRVGVPSAAGPAEEV